MSSTSTPLGSAHCVSVLLAPWLAVELIASPERIWSSLCESHDRIASVYLRSEWNPLRHIYRSSHRTSTSRIRSVARGVQVPVLSKSKWSYPVRLLQFHPEDFDSHSSIADRIQTRWSTYQLKAQGGEFMEGIQNDCRTLKDLLQVSPHVQLNDRMIWAHHECS